MSDEHARIINTYDQLKAAVAARVIAKKKALCIYWQDRAVFVASPFFKTDPKAAWYHRGKKAFFGVRHHMGSARERRASAEADAIHWVGVKYGYNGEWTRNASRELVPAVVQKRFPIKRGPRPPAKVDDRVVEIEKDQILYVTVVTPERIGMAYRVDGPEAVCTTWDDFKRFFKVEC